MKTLTSYKYIPWTIDLIVFNALALLFYFTYVDVIDDPAFAKAAPIYWGIGNCTYIISLLYIQVFLYKRIVRPETIITRACKTIIIHLFLLLIALTILNIQPPRFYILVSFYIPVLFFVCMGRLFLRKKIKTIRSTGKDIRTAIVVGTDSNITDIIEIMGDVWNGYKLLGIFDDEKPPTSFNQFPYLGKVEETIKWLSCHQVEEVYCGLPSSRSKEILPLLTYCENNLIRFYIVPSYRNYLKRKMTSRQFGDLIIFTLHKEPLEHPKNRQLKRKFDFLFSTLFLCSLYPLLYVFIGLAIKLSSPGPVYFKQERTGLDGKTFQCLKFRSMRVNTECNQLQATKDDPRKTKIGDFLRRTNLDELPQFINVWKGEMSLVGPRPHMLRHTEIYSHLINEYMIRHLVKPGITGWAQINGFRGETKRLIDMQNRVKYDIWYLENWTFGLDIYIMYKTIVNMFKGESNAY